MKLPKDAFIPSPARAKFYVRRVKELEAANAVLVELLKEALPHVEAAANAFAMGPVRGPVEHLADDINAAIAKARESAS